MLSEKLTRWVEAQRPEPVVLSVAQIEAWAAENGFAVAVIGEPDSCYAGGAIGVFREKNAEAAESLGTKVSRWLRSRQQAGAACRQPWWDADVRIGVSENNQVVCKYTIGYSYQGVTDYSVTYTCCLPGSGYCGDVWASLEAEFIPSPVTVALPEATVELPTPAWVLSCDMEGQSWIESTRCFVSEVEETVGGFAQQLQKLLSS